MANIEASQAEGQEESYCLTRRCTACCHDAYHERMSYADLRILAGGEPTLLPPDVHVMDVADNPLYGPGVYWQLIFDSGRNIPRAYLKGECAQADGKCKVYGTKDMPPECRDFMAGSEPCLSTRRRDGLEPKTRGRILPMFRDGH